MDTLLPLSLQQMGEGKDRLLWHDTVAQHLEFLGW
jgi:hypothetical protein